MKLQREGPILTSTCDLYYLINGSANCGTGAMLYNQNLNRNLFTNSASSGCPSHRILASITCRTRAVLLRNLHDWTKTAQLGAAVRPLPDFLFFIYSVSHFRSPTGIRCNFPQRPVSSWRVSSKLDRVVGYRSENRIATLGKGYLPVHFA
jgi:hypothetical protein